MPTTPSILLRLDGTDVELPELGLWLDPHRASDFAFVSHAHAGGRRLGDPVKSCPSLKVAEITKDPMFCRPTTSVAGTLLLLCLVTIRTEADTFPVDSPEHQALTAAGPALADVAFALREDYWNGELTTSTGKAVKLQFFKRNTYSLFFGTAPSALPPGSSLHLNIFNTENEEVAAVSGKPGEAAVALTFENTIKSGSFLILMRVDVPPGPFAAADIPAVLFYGWK